MKESGEQQEQLSRLQGELQAATAVRPGREVLAVIPESRMSGELALLGAIALFAGAVCGLPGIPSLRGKLLSGAAGALIALLVFAGLVAVLPDTRLPYLLLALAGAVLAALCWVLSRALLLLRTRRAPPGQP
jgi:hypothetical protein